MSVVSVSGVLGLVELLLEVVEVTFSVNHSEIGKLELDTHRQRN